MRVDGAQRFDDRGNGEADTVLLLAADPPGTDIRRGQRQARQDNLVTVPGEVAPAQVGAGGCDDLPRFT